MAELQSFSYLARPDARILILGSMPGVASLEAAQYYAHPRNAFWRIMGDLVGASPELPYAQRVDRLLDAGIALWDVIARCRRPGSLDADIVDASVEVNDFSAFFAVHRDIRRIGFNGGEAASRFRQKVLPGLALPEVHLLRLPSTSPAHAALGYPEKLAAWRAILAE